MCLIHPVSGVKSDKKSRGGERDFWDLHSRISNFNGVFYSRRPLEKEQASTSQDIAFFLCFLLKNVEILLIGEILFPHDGVVWRKMKWRTKNLKWKKNWFYILPSATVNVSIEGLAIFMFFLMWTWKGSQFLQTLNATP